MIFGCTDASATIGLAGFSCKLLHSLSVSEQIPQSHRSRQKMGTSSPVVFRKAVQSCIHSTVMPLDVFWTDTCYLTMDIAFGVRFRQQPRVSRLSEQSLVIAT